MVNEQLRKELDEMDDKILAFDNPSYDNSIIGISTSGCVIYDADLMIKEFAEENGCTIEESMDFVYHNTVRALSHVSSEYKPIIKESIERWRE